MVNASPLARIASSESLGEKKTLAYTCVRAVFSTYVVTVVGC